MSLITIPYRFDSVEDFLSWLEKTPAHPEAGKSSRSGDVDFTGTHSLKEAFSLIHCGWPEGEELVATHAKAILGKIPGSLLTIQTAYDVVGDQWDMGKVMLGEPESAMVWQEREGGLQCLKVCVDIGFNCNTSAEYIQERGAMVGALIDALETSGNRCEVWACWRTKMIGLDASSNEVEVVTEIKIKSYDKALDMDRLAFWVVHPSALRRMLFLLLEKVDNYFVARNTRGGYGRSEPFQSPDADLTIPAETYITDFPAKLLSYYEKLQKGEVML